MTGQLFPLEPTGPAAPAKTGTVSPVQDSLFAPADDDAMTYDAAVARDLAVFALWEARLTGDTVEVARLERAAGIG